MKPQSGCSLVEHTMALENQAPGDVNKTIVPRKRSGYLNGQDHEPDDQHLKSQPVTWEYGLSNPTNWLN